MIVALKIEITPIAVVIFFVQGYPADSLSNLEFAAESHFWSIYKAESFFATE
jgi:hypothetical protein